MPRKTLVVSVEEYAPIRGMSAYSFHRRHDVSYRFTTALLQRHKLRNAKAARAEARAAGLH